MGSSHAHEFTPGRHRMKHIHRDLERIKREILDMGALVEGATTKALSALVDRRIPLAQDVVENDHLIDDKEVAIELECLKILALHQPVATDLRFLITVLKVNNDLERVGDLATNIAQSAIYLGERPPIELPPFFLEMADRARGMVRDALDALVELDTDKARAVRDSDDDVDEFNRRMYSEMQLHMHYDPELIERAIYVLSCSRHLERIADLATNIAEDVVYLVEAEVIRHRRNA